MEGYLIYFLKVIILQSILFGFYWVISRNSTNFHFNRYFLLSALIIPFIIPLFSIPVNLFQQYNTVEGIFDPWFFIEQSLPIITISGSLDNSSTLPWWVITLAAIYFMVAIPSVFNLLQDYYKIYRLSKSSIKKEYTPKGFRLLYVPSPILSFSFLNKIFLSDFFPLKHHEKKTIITHEEYHLTQKHSLDVILAEFVRILCWFNPVILLIQNSLKETHEYLADRHTITHYGQNDYALLLKSFKWQEINMMLGSAYSSASIKNRLNMIEKSDKSSPLLQVILLILLTVSTVFLFACEDNLESFENRGEQSLYEISDEQLDSEITTELVVLQHAPEDVLDKYISLQKAHPEYLYMPAIKLITEEQLSSFDLKKLKNVRINDELQLEIDFTRMLTRLETEYFYSSEEIKEKNIKGAYAIIRKANRYQYMEYTHKMNTNDNSIHDDFQKMASFKGGMEALAKHLKENLSYPELAAEQGIEDKLVMRFVVNKGGGLVYLNVEQEPVTPNEEVSIEFQKAAFQALHTTQGLWEPAEKDGRYVMSKMTLPIEFKLDN